jgi:CheY-like chemotaxis protein
MRKKVLIVEDDAASRVALGALLTDAGYETVAVSARETAMQALRDEAPDLLIASAHLDGYSGLEVVAATRKMLPAIVLTTALDPAFEAEARELGAECLLRPVSPSALLATVRARFSAERAPFQGFRRWPRIPVSGAIPANVSDVPVHIVDVGYGGLQFGVDRTPGGWLPMTFNVRLPGARLAVDVRVVWKRRCGGSTWLCGAAVDAVDYPKWQQFIDAITTGHSAGAASDHQVRVTS